MKKTAIAPTRSAAMDPGEVHEKHERTRKRPFFFVSFRDFRRHPATGAALVAFAFLPAALGVPEAPSPLEAKLRESVKALTLQVRAAENEKATLSAEKDEAAAKAAALGEESEKLKKEAADEKAKDALARAEVETRVAAALAELMAKEKSLAEWKKAHAEVTAQAKKLAEIGNAREAERAKLAARVIVLDRQVADQKTKNAGMHKLGTEILSRYEKFGLGDVITRKEPFIGTTRVKFDTLIQDFSDGLADQKIKP